MKSVYIDHRGIQPDTLAVLEQHAVVTFAAADGNHEAGAVAAHADAIMIGGQWQITGDLLDRMPTVASVGRPGVGYDNVDVDACTERGVVAFNYPPGPAPSTGEMTVALLLAIARKLRVADRQARRADFGLNESISGVEIVGKTLGIVGLGRIGGRVAEICSKGLNMRVLAYDPYRTREEAVCVGATLVDDLAQMLQAVDFLSLHVPPSKETPKMIGVDQLALMKPTAFLINCGRGVLVDEAALYQALTTDRLAGAALDVFDPEPPSPDNPLLTLDNVIVTPHIASFTAEGRRAMYAGAVEQIIDVFQGRRPAFILNPDVWDRPNRRSLR